MAALVDDSQNKNLFFVRREVGDVRETQEGSPPDIVADGPEPSRLLHDLLEELSSFREEVISQARLLIVVPGCGAFDVAQSLLLENQFSRHRAAAR